MPARVFISHSGKDGEPEPFLDALLDALKDFPTVVDRHDLELGSGWRARINAWLGGCDAAIVLLSKPALASSYVAYEASILTYRDTVDDAFVLIPVFLDGIDYQCVQRSILGPSQIHEVMGVLQQDGAIAAILERLEAAGSAVTPLDNVTQLIVDRVQQVPEHYLESVIRELGEELEPWKPGAELRRHAAQALLAAGPVRSMRQLDPFRDLVGRDLADLVELLGCSWVDYRASRELPVAAETRRPVAVGADHPDVVKMYVVRAGVDKQKRRPGAAWTFVEADGVAGPGGTLSGGATLVAQVRTGLMAKLDVDEAELEDELAFRAREGEPVFAVLPAAALTSNLLQTLREHFDTLTFLVLAREVARDRAALDEYEILLLEPLLEPDDETSFVNEYADACRYARRA